MTTIETQDSCSSTVPASQMTDQELVSVVVGASDNAQHQKFEHWNMHITRWPRAHVSKASNVELDRRSTYPSALAPPTRACTTRTFLDQVAPPPATQATHLWPGPSTFGPEAPPELTALVDQYNAHADAHPDPVPDKETLREWTKTWNDILAKQVAYVDDSGRARYLCSEPADLLQGPTAVKVPPTPRWVRDGDCWVRVNVFKPLKPGRWAEVMEQTDDEVLDHSETPVIIAKGLRETTEGIPPSRTELREKFRQAQTPEDLRLHPKYRDMVIEWNCTFEGMTAEEVARQEGITPEAARQRRHRFRDLADLKLQFTEQQLKVMRENWTCVVVLHGQEYIKVLGVPYDERDYDPLMKAKDLLMKATLKGRKKQLQIQFRQEKLDRWERIVRWMQEQARIMLAYADAYLFDPEMVKQVLPEPQGTNVTLPL